MQEALWPAVLILGYVTLQRLGELVIARANTRRLLAQGGIEVGAPHYPLIVALHAAWLVTLWLLAPGRPAMVVPLVLFALVQVLRFWTLASIGRRWTTRIVVVPGETLVARGPYRFIRHPNYTVVVLEIALLPLVFGLGWVALLFSILNALALAIRIPAEAKALAEHAHRVQPSAGAARRSA
ncbi:isoprenylcysteine carboxyl methyltransferase family protein [Aureimonas leprariae]|uniref:Methyltransferase n=1 Tax=Plantimonas leprariae TaxID=2615207 RepID=A0A7V7PKV6_9HYPH|nr:isoprenylcysteine carboxylmethyltransferase family protein [Aureimonas leprariae]KAB0676665.1 hypothetical protein F6X38_20355 [Aureimonas leprariae]